VGCSPRGRPYWAVFLCAITPGGSPPPGDVSAFTAEAAAGGSVAVGTASLSLFEQPAIPRVAKAAMAIRMYLTFMCVS